MAAVMKTTKTHARSRAWTDPAKVAAQGLNSALNQSAEETHPEPNIPSADAPEVVPVTSDRKALRVLVVTTDTSIFSEGSPAQKEYFQLSAYFDELHIAVLCARTDAVPKSLRIAANAWVYATHSRSPFFAVFGAYQIATEQLEFASGFHVDLVLATDAFESGLAAYAIARHYKRPLQLQLTIDPFDLNADDVHAGLWWKLVARFVVRRTACVLVPAVRLQHALTKRYRRLRDKITVVPPFYDIATFRDATPTFSLHEQFPQFKFVLLVVSGLEEYDRVDFAIDVCAPIIQQYPTIGMFIIGDGHERPSLEKKVRALGLTERIIFVTQTDDLVSYMKGAQLYINVMNDEAHGALVSVAAASALPVLTVGGGIADTIFEDGVNAFVCPEDDLVCMQARLGEFLNDNHLRDMFSINGRDQVFAYVHQDVASYRDRFVGTLESCLLKTYTGK